jgi:hypothetical protein
MVGAWAQRLLTFVWMNSGWFWKRCLKYLRRALLALAFSSAAAVMLVHLLSPHGFCYRSDPDQEERMAQRRLIAALEMFDAKHGDGPQTLNSLVEDGVLAAHVDLADVWHRQRRYVCHKDRMVIWSAGPDGRFDTADDLKTTTLRADPLAP